MLFNSLTFVVFFVVVVTGYWSIKSWQARKNLLVVASYIFYGAWNSPFAALLFGTTAMDFIGDSRAWFDVDLDEFQKGLGKRPIQLAMAGSTVLPALADLAEDK